MKFKVEVCLDPDSSDDIDEAQVEIGDIWLEKMPRMHAFLKRESLSSIQVSYEGTYTFLKDGEPVEPEYRVDGCHLKIMNYGNRFRFIFPYRDGAGEYAATDCLTLEDAIR